MGNPPSLKLWNACRETYQRGLGEVTEDGGNWVEGMKLVLQNWTSFESFHVMVKTKARGSHKDAEENRPLLQLWAGCGCWAQQEGPNPRWWEQLRVSPRRCCAAQWCSSHPWISQKCTHPWLSCYLQHMAHTAISTTPYNVSQWEWMSPNQHLNCNTYKQKEGSAIYLDDHHMVRVLPRLIQDSVAGNHVVDNIALGDLLGAEGLRSRQIHAIVVSQMVIAHNGCWLSPPSSSFNIIIHT